MEEERRNCGQNLCSNPLGKTFCPQPLSANKNRDQSPFRAVNSDEPERENEEKRVYNHKYTLDPERIKEYEKEMREMFTNEEIRDLLEVDAFDLDWPTYPIALNPPAAPNIQVVGKADSKSQS